ncbi:hypothetical protein [Azospirillum largimobile]
MRPARHRRCSALKPPHRGDPVPVAPSPAKTGRRTGPRTPPSLQEACQSKTAWNRQGCPGAGPPNGQPPTSRRVGLHRN